ncbi:hypothetical protein KJ570_01930 [Patescibacteria group bacterium]|nr:hypothetical protein [Patescibacteria group bacterium]MBU2036346.1 hypothetical protein [Patescibacteria group bacterium]
MNNTIEKWRKSNKLNKLLNFKGFIISLTKIENTDANSQGPTHFWIALAKIENKSNLLLQLVNESQNPKIGDKVKIVLRRVKNPNKTEIIEYGYKFKKIN